MGASQSKVSETAITEKLTERLRAMQIENEKDYLLIEKAFTKRGSTHLEDVSVSATEKWTEDLLSDPKVCSKTGLPGRSRTNEK
jgi:bleomycin hydrolase